MLASEPVFSDFQAEIIPAFYFYFYSDNCVYSPFTAF